jgi:hypothetical protein
MAHPVPRAAGRSLAGGLLALVLPFVVLGFAGSAGALVAFLLPLEDMGRVIAGAATFLACVALFAVLALVFAMFRTRALDPHLAPLGLRGRSLIPNIREYAGVHGAYEAHATYARRGGVLQFSLEVPVRTSATFSVRTEGGPAPSSFIGRQPPIPSPDPALAGIAITGDDAEWVTRLISSPGVPAALRALLDDPSGREARNVALRPASVVAVRRGIDPDAAGPTLAGSYAALTRLAEACQRLGPPLQPQDERTLERLARRHPTFLALALVALVLGVLLVPAAILAAALFLSSGV